MRKEEVKEEIPAVDIIALDSRVAAVEAWQVEIDKQLAYMTDKLKKSRLL